MEQSTDHSTHAGGPSWPPPGGADRSRDRTLALWTAPRRFAGFKRFALRHFPAEERLVGAIETIGADQLDELAQLFGFDEDRLAQLVAIYLGLPYRLRLDVERIDFRLLPRHFCERQLAVPLRSRLGRPQIALGNPFRWALAHAFETRRLGVEEIDFVIVTPQEARRALDLSRRSAGHRRRGPLTAEQPIPGASRPLEPLHRLLFRHPLPSPTLG